MILIFIAIFVSVCYNMRRKIIARNPSRSDQEEKEDFEYYLRAAKRYMGTQ